MPSTFSGLSVASSALAAQRRAIEATGHNIANVNTPGYSRQRVDLAAIDGSSIALHAGSHYQAGGVDVAAQTRIVDQVLVNRVNTERAALGLAVSGLLPAIWLRVVHLRPLRPFFPLPFALPLPSPLRTRAAAALAIWEASCSAPSASPHPSAAASYCAATSASPSPRCSARAARAYSRPARARAYDASIASAAL